MIVDVERMRVMLVLGHAYWLFCSRYPLGRIAEMCGLECVSWLFYSCCPLGWTIVGVYHIAALAGGMGIVGCSSTARGGVDYKK